MDNIQRLFSAADHNLNCNTAYPVFKNTFSKYSSDRDIMNGVHELSYYIHIPFCRHLCAFCEYTRFRSGNKPQEDRYTELLTQQVETFLGTHTVDRLYGLDIGGGTPTALDSDNFEKVLRLAQHLEKGVRKVPDYEKSIEISFTTIDRKKISLIGEYGFERVSAGIQSMDYGLLERYGREFRPIHEMSDTIDGLHWAGVKKINLDLMYGMPGQTEGMIRGAVQAIQLLKPEQVTLYEMRFNRVGMQHEKVTRDTQYSQYEIFYDALTEIGYHGCFGRNTFSLSPTDDGVSSYLRHRMTEAVPYKGFGISAQSMSPKGLSYGSLKNAAAETIPDIKEIGTASNYMLPAQETSAKYVSIGMYNGGFRLDILSNILHADAESCYSSELRFLRENSLIEQHGNQIRVTRKGFRYYGAIAALFWSDEQKKLLLQNAEKGL